MSAALFPATRNLRTTKAENRVGTDRIAALTGYSDLVVEMGGNPSRLLARCGLDSQIFNDADNVIPSTVSVRLLALAAEETRCPHFGLLLGQRRNRLASVGPVGFLVQNSPTLEDALRNLIRYIHLHEEGVTSTLLVQRGEALFTVSIDLSGIVGAEQLLDTATADIFSLIRMICGREWLPSAVHFASRPPEDLAPYRALFRAPVHFDREITCLRFPAYWLERPVPDADPDLCSLMQSYVTQIEQQYSGDFSGQIRRVVRTMLPTSKCTAVRIAELFSVSLRTLQRHLAANGTSFEAIVDETRHEIATHNLAETNKPISRLAAMLGYRDSRAFTRAFRRWSGAAPSEWRAHQRKILA